MRTFHKLKNHYHCPIINLDKIWTLVGEEVRAPSSPKPRGSRFGRPAPRQRAAAALAAAAGGSGGVACVLLRTRRACRARLRTARARLRNPGAAR
jgi:hypothetical protein